MTIKRDRLFAACLSFLLVSAPALAEEPADSPGRYLTLQVPFRDNMLSTVGPAPIKSAAGARFPDKEGRRGLDLRVKDASAAVWDAGEILSNAQGAVSFFVRLEPGEKGFALMRLSGTSAGAWESYGARR